jgi:uncharacterized YccA/Bax inhibitor family protein
MSQSMDTAFKRIQAEYTGRPSASGGFGTSLGGPAWAPPTTFKASRAYDKLLGLTALVLVSAVAGWAVVPLGIAVVAMFVAFAAVLVSWFRMGWARVLAPIYAVCEGVFLGAISGVYATLGHGIIPLAVVFTGGVFLGGLAVYRVGLLRVTPRVYRMAMMGAMGLIAVAVLSLFIGLPGLNSFGPVGVIIGLLCLFVAVTNLFVDFDYVQRAEALGMPADAEWASAFAMLTALVLVYLSILRIIASLLGGGRRR